MKNLFSYLFLASGLCAFSQSFNVDSGFITSQNTWMISSSLELPEGKILITGFLGNYLGQNINSIARLNSNGSIDSSFQVGTGPNAYTDIHEAYLCADGKILLGGNFNSFNGHLNRFVTRLNSNGTVDDTFHVGAVFSNMDENDVYINSFAVDTDGKIYVAGRFSAFYGNGTGSHYSLIRLNPDGSLDTSFDYPLGGAMYEVVSIIIQDDGKIITATPMLTGVRRFNYDGSIDSTFTVNNIAQDPYSIYQQPDGKIVVGGVLGTSDSKMMLLRLNEDGSLDDTFMRYDLGFPEHVNYVRTITPYEDGFLIGGRFDSFGGSGMSDFAAVNHDGTVDTNLSFAGVEGLSGPVVSKISVLSNHKILISGSFSMIGNTPTGGLARLGNPLLETVSFEKNKSIVYSTNNSIQFSSVSEVYDTILLYDISGRLIESLDNLNDKTAFVSIEKNNQIYIYKGTFVDGSSFEGKIVH